MTAATTAELDAVLRERIGRVGFVTVAEYMAAVSAIYYARGEAFGRGGDFVTAPEISQAFGEIVGLWCAVTWRQMGEPRPFALVECGPGRGTLMADALRAARQVPGFVATAAVHLVERSPALRERQRTVLQDHRPQWHDDIAAVPAGPAIFIGNEFLDALPVRQFQLTTDGWAERVIVLAPDGRLGFATRATASAPVPIALAATAKPGAIFERSEAVADVVGAVAERLVRHGGAALFIDYGHSAAALGETLQAVKHHAYHPVLEAPGTADITAHVDFAAVAAAARARGARVFGPVEQGVWLRRLGIGVRQVQLARGKPGDVARTVEQGIRRLTEPHGMGALFKAIALAHPGLAHLEGFELDQRS
jgi:NADH dehydrogenase [ubiquinone] 1 alpha subcomplex assembly factor 7